VAATGEYVNLLYLTRLLFNFKGSIHYV